MTTTRSATWTRELSTTTLERIFTVTTDTQTRREVDVELMRRDDLLYAEAVAR